MIKNISEYTKNKSCKDGLCYSCRACNKQWNIDHKEEQKKYCEANKVKIAIRMKQYRIDNKEKTRIHQKEYRKQYYIDHREDFKRYNNEHKEYRTIWKKQYNETHKEERNCQRRERFKNDPEYAIICRLRSATRRFINNKTNPKSINTEILLGTDWYTAIAHIKSLGYKQKIHDLDHIVPLAVFNPMDIIHQRIMFNYLNLQPTSPNYNYIKHTKLLSNWKETIIGITSMIDVDPIPVIEYIKKQNPEILYEDQSA